MPFVAIFGAGPLGGALAYALASRGRFDEVRLIDAEKSLAAGKALDILQSGPVDGYSTRVTGSATFEAANGAWVTVLADPVQAAPLAHLAELHRRSPGAVIVCADASHRTVLARAVATGAVPPDRLLGVAPAAMAAAARALIALEVDLSPSLVQVGVGTAGDDRCAVDWDRTSVDGVPAGLLLRRERQVALDDRLAALWPQGPLTLGAAAARIAEAAWFGARQVFPCWWVTDGGASAPAVHTLRFTPGGQLRSTLGPGAGRLASSGPGR